MISAVFVIYDPDIDLLEVAVNSLVHQVDNVFLVDNSLSSSLGVFSQCDKIEVIELKNNLGIAAAQNVGIQKALTKNSNYIVLSDQDTIFPAGFIEDMLPHFDRFPWAAAIVPRFKDSRMHSSNGFIANRPFWFSQFYPEHGQHRIFQAIASGKILRAEFIGEIGLMNERLFIDWVDFEWCWRARERGFEIIGNADVVIEHQLGDVSSNIGFREITLRSPIRHYYITRNAFYLSIYSKELDRLHRLNLFFRAFRYILGFPLISKPRAKNLKAVLLGFFHGVRGVLGKLDGV
ncbi:glycosyltransferase family 2 protein [Marinobacter sp. Z-F4-2]|nr:glycosyltransferase family 2 protein [Marinobacter sp. Z-F4-2]